jgi:hypothetical protein
LIGVPSEAARITSGFGAAISMVFALAEYPFFICWALTAESALNALGADGAGCVCGAAAIWVVVPLLDVSQATVAKMATMLSVKKYFFMLLLNFLMNEIVRFRDLFRLIFYQKTVFPMFGMS